MHFSKPWGLSYRGTFLLSELRCRHDHSSDPHSPHVGLGCMVPKLKMPFLSCYNYLCYPDPARNESSALTAVCLHWVTARTRRVVRWDMSSLGPHPRLTPLRTPLVEGSQGGLSACKGSLPYLTASWPSRLIRVLEFATFTCR